MIIISGNSRSGTTMTGRILGNHSRVFTFQELHFFDELVGKENIFAKRELSALGGLFAKLVSTQRDGYFMRGKGLSYLKESEEAVHLSHCETPADVYKTFVLNETKRQNKSMPCEQTPQNIFALNDMFRIFPEARAVIMIRDPREVLLSQKNKWKRKKFTTDVFPASEALRARLNYHPVTISKIWKAVSETARLWQQDERVLTVKFENLLADPESVVKKICEHCGLHFETSMLDIPVVGSSHTVDSPASRKGVDGSRSGKWKTGLKESEIKICQDITGNEMLHWGYASESVNPGKISLYTAYVSMPFKLIMSLPFNLKRLKDPIGLLKRLF